MSSFDLEPLVPFTTSLEQVRRKVGQGSVFGVHDVGKHKEKCRYCGWSVELALVGGLLALADSGDLET